MNDFSQLKGRGVTSVYMVYSGDVLPKWVSFLTEKFLNMGPISQKYHYTCIWVRFCFLTQATFCGVRKVNPRKFGKNCYTLFSLNDP